jgi:hypothetical protein
VLNYLGVLRILGVGCGVTFIAKLGRSDYQLMKRFCLVVLNVYVPLNEWDAIDGFHDGYVISGIREHNYFDKYDLMVTIALVEYF